MASSTDTHRIVVVGGGITGLTAAYSLTQAASKSTNEAAPHPEIMLLESTDRLGGKILTTPFMGRPVDEGADSFITRVPWGLDLVRRLDIGSTISPAVGKALVVSTRSSTALRELPQGLVMGVPTSPWGLLRSRLVGVWGVSQALGDLLRRDDWPGPNETVGELVTRRLGSEVADDIVGPLLGGINAGDIHQLEALSVAPILSEAAREGGSLMRALRTRSPASTSSAGASPSNAAEPKPIFASFEGGMGALTNALESALKQGVTSQGSANTAQREVQLRTGVTVKNILPTSGGAFELTTSTGESISANSVMLTTPTFAAAQLLVEAAPQTAALLHQIPYASVAIVTLGFDRSQVKHRLERESGFLVPKSAGMLTTACSFGSTKWPHWADDDKVVLRVSVGRHGDSRAETCGDQELVDTVMSELSPLLGITGEPLEQRVSRWNNGLPQYLKGHQALVGEIDATLSRELPGVRVAGAGYRGLGVPACIHQANQAAAALLPTARLPATKTH